MPLLLTRNLYLCIKYESNPFNKKISKIHKTENIQKVTAAVLFIYTLRRD